MNIRGSRWTFGWLTPYFQVVWSADTKADDKHVTVFEPGYGWTPKSLWAVEDRMDYVAKVTRDFNRLMKDDRAYMEGELKKIQAGLDA